MNEERRDSLGRRIPPQQIEVHPRQWVVALGEAARNELFAKYGVDPSPATIEEHMKEAWRNPRLRIRVNIKAYKLIDQELGEAIRISEEKGGTKKEIRKRARRLIQEKYERVEQDPERNYSYLDGVVLSD